MKSDFKISYPGSEKVYVHGTIHPEIKVGMRKVNQMPTVTIKNGERTETPNPFIYIYDTSGPYSDDHATIDIEKGLPHLREPWIRQRTENDKEHVCQMYYAKKGIITVVHPVLTKNDETITFYCQKDCFYKKKLYFCSISTCLCQKYKSAVII